MMPPTGLTQPRCPTPRLRSSMYWSKERNPDMAEKTMVEAVRDAMFEEMKRDDSIILMGEDVGEGGVFRASEGLRNEFGPDRIMDTPLAEACIVGSAIG